MKRPLTVFAGLALVSLIFTALFTSEAAKLGAVAFGLGLFALNAGLLILLARRLFSGGRTKLNPLFVPAMFLKVFLLAIGAYVALVPLDLSAAFFVGGLVGGLALFAVSFLVCIPRGMRV